MKVHVFFGQYHGNAHLCLFVCCCGYLENA
jgi:hypothetical protein